MSKKIFFLLLTIILFGIGLYYFILIDHKTIISFSLSDRAKEYLKSNNRSRELKNILSPSNSGKSISNTKELARKDCYYIIIPFTVTIYRPYNQDCGGYMSTDNPTGEITLSYRKMNTSVLDEVSDVVFRRANKNIYKEEWLKLDGLSYLTFKKIDTGFEESIFLMNNSRLFSVSLIYPSEDGMEVKINQLLNSLKLN